MMTFDTSRLVVVLVSSALLAMACSTQDPEPGQSETEPAEVENPGAMTLAELDRLIRRVDAGATRQNNVWHLSYEETPLFVVTDEHHDRMRIIAPVASANELDLEHIYRLLQANYETALDARYAIADRVVWSTFIHPLSPLDEDEFLSGLAQTITLVITYGTTFSSGALRFGDAGDAGSSTYNDVIRKGSEI